MYINLEPVTIVGIRSAGINRIEAHVIPTMRVGRRPRNRRRM